MSSELHQYITTTYLVPMKSRDWINGALITFHLLLGLRLFCWTLRGRPGFPALPLTSFPAGFWLGMASRWGQQVRGEMGWVCVPCCLHCLAHQQSPEIPPPRSLHSLGLVTPLYPPLSPQHHGDEQLLSVPSFWAFGHACLVPLTLSTLL